MATAYSKKTEQRAMRSYTLVEINTDDTESDVATESAHTEIEALMAFSKEVGHELELCDFSDRAEFYLKWLSGGAYERMPVRSK
jgi:hypothetical protein